MEYFLGPVRPPAATGDASLDDEYITYVDVWVSQWSTSSTPSKDRLN